MPLERACPSRLDPLLAGSVALVPAGRAAELTAQPHAAPGPALTGWGFDGSAFEFVDPSDAGLPATEAAHAGAASASDKAAASRLSFIGGRPLLRS